MYFLSKKRFHHHIQKQDKISTTIPRSSGYHRLSITDFGVRKNGGRAVDLGEGTYLVEQNDFKITLGANKN